ncbi:hypothetical protein BCT90_02680 [Vibrio lentus]|uniref:restriction endonuclease PLD domain-containing protein n=1 Tax=Vibrio TaxID=662 RepID=UPI000C82A9D4|nr:restriction endonuclease PLD domain-containing protein [Vibrio lentus]PMH92093.1 hypothetical protein BCU56_10415 [Vibrio lentus]PMI08109.1 hypothetical protein BCU53_09065 [Vibrio lentus]PMJ16348.1 hypothetical protein BCU29_10380 [Vibrio lentus]PML02736.1 hypothetical protein BCT90_02680 [Vibrio lentus]
MFVSENLYNLIFERHKTDPEIDELVIISGYLGPRPIQNLKDIPLNINVYYGMYGSDGISQHLHNKLLESQSFNNLNIYYCMRGIHSKCYIWKSKGKIVDAISGSANFSMNGLTTPYREILSNVDNSTYDSILEYENYIHSISKKCNTFTYIKSKNKGKKSNILNNRNSISSNTCRLSLLSNENRVPDKSGLNWGYSSGNVSPGDSYIPVRKKDLINHPVLFPPKQNKPATNKNGRPQRHNDVIEIIWDDGFLMEGLLEQSQDMNGVRYPKAISSSPRKNILGSYLRKRLGLNHDDKITKKHLEDYGRTDISISMLGGSVYLFDFSVL